MKSSEKNNQPNLISKSMLNKLRASVLGANDGIVSTSSVVMGVAGATSQTIAIVTAGLAALVAGALSMAVGEYVSVSSQSDAEKVHHERESTPQTETPETTNAMHAAVASLISFTVGGLVPFLAIVLAPESIRIYVTIVAVVLALFVTGYASATIGGASRIRAISRVIIGGLLAMAITYLVGKLFGASIA